MTKLRSTENLPSNGYRYRAFLSYRSSDARIAKWLHTKLERYRVPRSLVGRLGTRGPIPARIGTVFRDRDDARTAEDIETIIALELSKAEQLIVLCSPSAVEPESWVPREIELFRSRRPDGTIHAVIIDGQPPSCFPAPLLKSPHEGALRVPLAADLRSKRSGGQDGRSRAVIKIISGLIGAEFDELWRRERRRRLRTLLANIVALIVLSVLVGSVFKKINDISDSRQLAAHSLNLIDNQYDLALLLSAEAFATSPTEEAQDALLRTLLARPYFRQFVPDEGTQVAVNPDQSFIATGDGKGEVRLYELPTMRLLHTFTDPSGESIRALRFSKNGSRLAVLSEGKNLVVLDTAHWNVRQRFEDGFAGFFTTAFDYDTGNTFGTVHATSGFNVPAAPLAFSLDGSRIAFADKNNVVVVADVDTGLVTTRIPGGARVNDRRPAALSFSEDMQHLGVATPAGVEVWHLNGSAASPELSLDNLNTADVILLSDNLVVGLASNGRLFGVELSHNQKIFDIPAHISKRYLGGSEIGALLAWIPPSNILVSASMDGEIAAWNLAELLSCRDSEGDRCKPLARFSRARGGYLSSLTIGGDGKTILSAAYEGTVEQYALAGSDDLLTGSRDMPNARLFAVASDVQTVAFSDGRKVLIVTGEGGRHEIPIPAQCHMGDLTDLALSPNGRSLVVVGTSIACLHEVSSSGAVSDRILTVPSSRFRFAPQFVFNHDASRLVGRYSQAGRPADAGDDDVGTVEWDLQEPEARAHTIPALIPVGFFDDATLIGREGNGEVVEKDLRDTASLSPAKKVVAGLTGDSAFSIRTGAVYTTDNPGIVVKSDLRNGKSEELFDSANRPAGEYLIPAVSPDGERIALANSEGGISLWTSEGHRIGSFFMLPGEDPVREIRRLAFTDGHARLLVQQEGSIFRLNLSPADWAKLARARAGRLLRPDERDRYSQPTLRFNSSTVDENAKAKETKENHPLDACFIRQPDASLFDSDQMFQPLACNETLRQISSILKTTQSPVQDEQVCSLYARAIDQLPLLLSGIQREWAGRALKRHDLRTQDALVLIGITGNKPDKTVLEALSSDDLTPSEDKVRLWALVFLDRQGRDVSEKGLTGVSASVTLGQMLAWPNCVNGKSTALTAASTGSASWPHLRQTRFPVSNLSAIIYSTVTEKPHGSEFAVLADVFMEATDYDAARLAISRALQLQPEDGFALNLAGLVELRSGHCEAALQYFSRSLASGRRDGWPQYNTALCQERLGHLGDAESSYTAAISEQVKPQSQGDRAQFLNGYAWFLVTHFGNNRTKLTVAKTYAQEAVNITRERDSNILDTLAAIRFATGDRLGAVTLETKALEIAQADNKDVTAIARNLEKYRAH